MPEIVISVLRPGETPVVFVAIWNPSGKVYLTVEDWRTVYVTLLCFTEAVIVASGA